MVAQRVLDRAGREVLAVHADPVGVAAGEEEVAVGVEVARGRRTSTSRSASSSRSPSGCCSSPRTGPTPRGVHDLADALVGVGQPARRVEAGPRLLGAVLVDHLDSGADEPERARPLLGVAVDRDAALGRAVRVDDLDAEAAGELLDDLRRALVAERDPQRVVRVVGVLGLGEQVAERLAGVVEVRGAVVPDVGQPARRGELAGQPDARAVHDRRRPADLHRVRVEERHADVADVVGAEVHDDAHAIAGDEQTALRADHGLRRVRRPAREDQRPDRVDRRLEAGVGGVVPRERGLEGRTDLEHRREVTGDRGQQLLVLRLGDDQPAVGVLDVAQQVLAPPGVVEADHRRARQRGAAEREEVLRAGCRAAPRRAGAHRRGAGRGRGWPSGPTPRRTPRG